MNCHSTTQPPAVLEQAAPVNTAHRGLSIGLPRCTDPNELRFPLTPEGAKVLVDNGLCVRMQHDAAASIHYTDTQYERCGVCVTDRAEVLQSDIVISLSPLTPAELRRMRRGTLLLTTLEAAHCSGAHVRAMLEHGVITVAIDLVEDKKGNTPFADILSEIDGRAAIAIASSLLADAVHGKGILLGGIAGVVPCEVTIVGSGIAACAAAHSAQGAGAMVRMFDNDVYRLRQAERSLGGYPIGSTLHPRVLASALASADVVVITENSSRLTLGADDVDRMKKGVIIFDLTSNPGRTFPSLPTVDLASAAAFARVDKGSTRVCYINAGSAVPRTAAMGLSNAFITLFSKISTFDGIANALKLVTGLQRATLTFLGKAVNPNTAHLAQVRHVDISIYLTIS